MPQLWSSSEKTPRVEVSERGRSPEAKIVRSRSTQRSKSRRRSWFGGRPDDMQALSPMPSMPSTITAPHQPEPPTNTDKRRSMAVSIKSLRRRSNSTKRASFWASSNPDDSDSGVDMPPVPPLYRGQSMESVSTASQLDSPTAAPPQRKKYVPKSAAKSFLITTSGATEDNRKSYRRSFKLDENKDLVCLTREQQIEWAKLMNARERLETPLSNPVKSPAIVDVREKYANSQALAALEFGIPR